VIVNSESRLPVCALALVSLASFLFAQSPIGADEMSLHAAPYSPSPVSGIIRTQVEMVEVPTVVRDSNGVAIAGLRRGDFELFDAGKKQKISTFSVETFARARSVHRNQSERRASRG
jgi:hypothetical protein